MDKYNINKDCFNNLLHNYKTGLFKKGEREKIKIQLEQKKEEIQKEKIIYDKLIIEINNLKSEIKEIINKF